MRMNRSADARDMLSKSCICGMLAALMLCPSFCAAEDAAANLGVLIRGNPRAVPPRIVGVAGAFDSNDTVTLISIPGMLRFCCAKVLRQDGAAPADVRVMSHGEQPLTAVRLNWIPEVMAGGMAIAIKGNREVKRRGIRKLWIDLDGDGRAEMLGFCTSSEGVHITAWRQAGATPQRFWHAYHYVGYDLEPTCSPEEMR